MGGAYTTLRRYEGNAYKILIGKHERKRPLARPRCGWEDNIIMNQLSRYSAGLRAGRSGF
jgi:hypothetical protein